MDNLASVTRRLRFAMIATMKYRPELERLLFSLRRVHPHAPVNVYVDELAPFANPPGNANVVLLPEIARFGVKRARFVLYHREMQQGPFIYLDADVIVLDNLGELLGGPCLTACRDDLLACPVIADHVHPWPGDPQLVSHLYINSGVMGFGPEMARFTGRMLEMATDDAFWFKYIHPGGFFDQHVMCAQINLLGIDVALVPEQRFNWQGFRNNDQSLAAVRRGDTLIHAATGEQLHLVHFAGYRNIDAVIMQLPPEIAQLFHAVSVPPLTVERGLGSIWAGTGTKLFDADPHRAEAAMALSKELIGLCNMPREGRTDRYLEDFETVIATALTTPPSRVRWNNLLCGGYHLDPDEYVYFRELVTALKPKLLVEIGAGETSTMVARLAGRAIRIEPNAGPWLDRARGDGAKVHHVPFQFPGGFDEAKLKQALQGVGSVDLLFVDSPNGGRARSIAVRQILKDHPAKHVVFHDARRDAGLLLSVLAQHGDYVVADVYQSHRGFMVMSRRDCARLRPKRRFFPPLSEYVARIVADFDIVTLNAGQLTTSEVTVTNCSKEAWTPTGPNPVRVAYHIGSGGRHLVYDGLRTGLPCPMLPGDQLTLPIRIDSHGLEPSDYQLEVCMVEEQRNWFEDRSSSSILKRRARIEPALMPANGRVN